MSTPPPPSMTTKAVTSATSKPPTKQQQQHQEVKFIFQSPDLKSLFAKYKREHANETKQQASAYYTRPPSICDENDYIVRHGTLPPVATSSKKSSTTTRQVLPKNNDVSKKVQKIIVNDQNDPEEKAKSHQDDKEQEQQEQQPPKFSETNFYVVNMDTVSAALCLWHDGGSVAALSFANDENPGGYYRAGARAQEEDLCRTITELYDTLIVNGGKFYPLLPGEALLSQDLYVIRRPGDYSIMNEIFENPDLVIDDHRGAERKDDADDKNDDDQKEEEKPDAVDKNEEQQQEKEESIAEFFDKTVPKVSVITAAMPRGLGDKRPPGGFMNPQSEWYQTVSLRIRAVLRAAKISGKKDLVLGAFGSGAFNNNPKYVAQIFKEQLCGSKSQEFRGCFERVVFAIIDPMMTGNLKPYVTEFEK